MHSLLMLLIGGIVGAALMAVVLVAGDSAYVQRQPRDATTADEITRWIERDNCHPVTLGDHLLYYRCPRFRL